MADFDPALDAGQMDSNADHPTAAARVGAALNVVGAAASLALIAGIAVWGYKLVMRDVSGVPVVRAVEGPMRLAPEHPGGRPADHQGLAVNAVAASGSAEAPADRLVLAPRPVSLLAEDKPLPVIAAETSKAKQPAADMEESEAVADATDDTDDAGGMQAMVNQLIADVLPGANDASGPKVVKATVRAPISQPAAETSDAKADEMAEIMPAVVQGPGPKLSPRPRTRPAQLVQAALTRPATVAEVRDVDPDTIPAGTRLAQLGAFESRAVAVQEWERLNGRFSDYLDGKDRVIQKATSGGRTFYRLRAMGFDDLSDARRFCSALVAEKADCIPVAVR